MLLHDLFDWSNAGVGVAGLALTVGAIWQATGAKSAARAAKAAISKRLASDAFAHIEKIAAELTLLLQLERGIEAAVRARDLVSNIPRDRAQFGQHLGGDSDKLKVLETLFQHLAVRLSSRAFFEDRMQVESTMETVLGANCELSAIYGRLLAHLNEEET